MLYRLQSMLGDRVFAKVLRDWPQGHRYQNVDRREWIHYLDHTTGRHLGHFVRSLADQPNAPHPDATCAYQPISSAPNG